MTIHRKLAHMMQVINQVWSYDCCFIISSPFWVIEIYKALARGPNTNYYNGLEVKTSILWSYISFFIYLFFINQLKLFWYFLIFYLLKLGREWSRQAVLHVLSNSIREWFLWLIPKFLPHWKGTHLTSLLRPIVLLLPAFVWHKILN